MTSFFLEILQCIRLNWNPDIIEPFQDSGEFRVRRNQDRTRQKLPKVSTEVISHDQVFLCGNRIMDKFTVVRPSFHVFQVEPDA